MRFKRSYGAVVLAVVLAVSLGACKKKEPTLSGENSETSAETIRVGEVGSMTGTDATFGISTHQGISLAIDEINKSGGIKGKRIELITLDNQGKPSEAVLATTKLITQNHVVAVLGEVASTRSIAMAPIAQNYKVPMISPSSINSKLTQQGDYIFRVCYIDIFQSKVMANFAANHLKSRRVAILTDHKSDYSRDSAEIFKEYFTKATSGAGGTGAGGEIVMEQSYSAGDVDFRSQLTAIRATKPDLILIPGHYTEVGLIARQARDLGMEAPLLGGDAWDSPKLTEIGGKALDGSYFVSHFNKVIPGPQVMGFVEKYKATYHAGIPDGLAALGYDAALVLGDALKRAKSLTPQDLRDALATTKDFQGVTGKISINAERNAVKPALVFKIKKDGTYEVAASIDPNAL